MSRLLALFALLLALPTAAQGIPFEPETGDTETEAETPAPRPAPPPASPAPARAPVEVRTVRADIRTYGPRRLGGPRTGLTLLSQETVRKINEAFGTCYDSPCDTPRLSESVPVVTQFGWQFENRMFQTESGLTGVTEWVLLVGGAEQGLFLPSLTLLAGIRAPSGFEFGVGPNLSLSGAAYAVGVGMNNEVGEISIPVNLAVVLGQDGPRTSLLVGFTVSERRW